MVRRALILRLPRLLGAVLLLAGLLLYQSWGTREILGLWSRPFACFLTATAIAVIGLAVDVFRRATSAPTRDVSMPALLFDGGVGAWGAAYLAAAFDSRQAGGRLLDGNAFGSLYPLASVLEWFALACFASGALLWAASRAGERGRRAVLSLATFAALALVAEAAFRAKTALWPEPQGFPTWLDRAWLRRHVRLNQEGFRDGEHPLEVPAGRRRMLVVGDSLAFGAGIAELRDRFGEQLAARLDPSCGVWEVVTAARRDSHTLDEIGFLERMLAYRPELVILVYVFNDIYYLSPSSDGNLVAGHPDRLLLRLHPTRLLFLNSYAFQQLYVRVRLARYGLTQNGLLISLELDRPSSPYDDPALLERHLADVSAFVARARAAGARVGVVPFDPAIVVDERYRDRYRRFRAGALGAGIPIHDLEHAFEGHSFDELTLNRLDRHPNELANRLAAASIALQLGKL